MTTSVLPVAHAYCCSLPSRRIRWNDARRYSAATSNNRQQSSSDMSASQCKRRDHLMSTTMRAIFRLRCSPWIVVQSSKSTLRLKRLRISASRFRLVGAWESSVLQRSGYNIPLSLYCNAHICQARVHGRKAEWQEVNGSKPHDVLCQGVSLNATRYIPSGV